MFVVLSAWSCAAQERKVKRLGDVATVYVQPQDKGDQEYLNEKLPWDKDQTLRQERLKWLRAVRSWVADKLAEGEVVTAAKDPSAAEAQLSIALAKVQVSEPTEFTQMRTDPNYIRVALYLGKKLLWELTYDVGHDEAQTATRLCAELQNAIRKDRAKQERKK